MEADLSPSAKVVHYYLHKQEYVESDGVRVYHSNIKLVAMQCGMMRNTVKKCFDELCREGFVEVLGKTAGRNAGFAFVIVGKKRPLHNKNYDETAAPHSAPSSPEYIL